MASKFLTLERRITDRDRSGVIERWRYGRLLLDAKAGRRQLPHGLIEELIKEAKRDDPDSTVSRREIQYRSRSAEAYDTETKVRSALHTFGSWRALCDAGFPPAEPHGSDPDDIEAAGLGSAPDGWEQLQLDIPGLKPTISVRGRKVQLVRGEDGARVVDVVAYRDMCRQMHENFGKTVDLVEGSVATMLAGCGGDETANAVEAWERGNAL